METNIYYSKTKTIFQIVLCCGVIAYGSNKIRLQGFTDSMIIVLGELAIIYLIYDGLKKLLNSDPVIKLSSYGIENKEYGLIPWSEIEYIRCPTNTLIIKTKTKEQVINFQIVTDLNISRQKLEREISRYLLQKN